MLNAAGLLAGLLACLAAGSFASLREGLAGTLLGAAIMLPLFLLRMVGGGDVKFLAAAGSVVGWRLLMPSFLLGALIGGAAGILLLLKRDRGVRGLSTRLALFATAGPHISTAPLRLSGSGLADFAMPYAVPLSIGLVTVCAASRFF